MARTQSFLSQEPTNIVSQPVTIGHIQLRDLIICPDERGVVDYVQDKCIMEREMTDPSSTSIPLVMLNFIPNTIASLRIPDSNERLIAAGGQDAELHLSIHTRRPKRRTAADAPPVRTRRLWQYDSVLPGSINNSVLLTSLSLTRSHESSAEPRVAVSNNDCTVKFYDVNVRGSKGVDGPPQRISEAGTLRLDVPVNHSSISPDGRTLLSVGDSPNVYLHGLTGGSRITFTQLAKLTLPPFDPACSSTIPASFSTAFSSCGTKFAVASQEGMVAVWDVRSRKPMKSFIQIGVVHPAVAQGQRMVGRADGYLMIRGIGRGLATERQGGTLTLHGPSRSQHTSLLHVVDASTFESEEIIKVPTIASDRSSSPPRPHATSSASEAIWRFNTHHPSSSRSHTDAVGGGDHVDNEYFERISRPGLTPATATVSPARAHHFRRMRRRISPRDERSVGAEAEDETHPNFSSNDHMARSIIHNTLRRYAQRTPTASSSSSLDDEHEQGEDMPDADVNPEDTHGEERDPWGDAELDGEMDVDEDELALELESDCITSRAGSPVPAAPRAAAWSRPASTNATPPPLRPLTQGTPQRGDDQAAKPRIDPNLDLAGTCFDPSGRFLYVASTGGIVEWSVSRLSSRSGDWMRSG
ncbi:hypothetical protein EW146_g9807 [Bondarzewia mesenterica]|uniref:DUF2415 domain-containing protein n=1 Tax=Bondarzewia mesenterica TaxID=1095465 RepID=A0A4S4L352_9AGAM|nr:hypothetical protein EW146_g9807 [Bondarzewia mesenterica]